MLTVATSIEGSDAVLYYTGDKFRFHENPMWSYSSLSGLHANFDLYLDTYRLRSSEAAIGEYVTLGKRYIRFQRHPKRTQMRLLDLSGFLVPNYTYLPAHTQRGDNSAMLTNHVADMAGHMNQLVIKENYGAAGNGLALVPLANFANFYYEHVTLGKDMDPKEKGNYRMGGTAPKFQDNRPLVTEFIKAAKEYRVIMGSNGKVIGCERKVNGQNGWQANGNADQISKKNLVEAIGPDMLKKLQAFVHSQDMPFLAFDLYKDYRGRVGIFEYSNQFGTLFISDRPMLNELVTENLDEWLSSKLDDDMEPCLEEIPS